jgi:3-hydroxybutyryl-CoA dehydrogenase
MSNINCIGVLGSGQMGAGIAQTAAQTGLQVLLADQSLEFAEKGKARIATQLKKLVEKAKMTEADAQKTLSAIQPVGALKDLGRAQLVVEAVTENPELKFKIFRNLDEACAPETILASNTSSISITAIAAQTKRPDKVSGMHFMNPVPIMKLVEGIRGLQTSDETFRITRAVAEKMGKTFIEAKDQPGFAVNRILMPMINEAVTALHEGIASAEDIDTAMKLGTNQPMGPLTLADFIGLDTCLAIMEVLHDGLGDSKYRPSPLLKQYVAAGWFGKKTGRGFYKYD